MRGRDLIMWSEGHKPKGLHNWKDVLLDIEESSLSEEEKISEREYVTNIRKEELGSNYIYCPPWSS